jgi:hypothetical protein
MTSKFFKKVPSSSSSSSTIGIDVDKQQTIEDNPRSSLFAPAEDDVEEEVEPDHKDGEASNQIKRQRRREDTTTNENKKVKNSRFSHFAAAISPATETRASEAEHSAAKDELGTKKKQRPTEDALPFCAPSPNKYRCRFKSTCEECFQSSKDCEHHSEAPLDLLLIGHNPSVSLRLVLFR